MDRKPTSKTTIMCCILTLFLVYYGSVKANECTESFIQGNLESAHRLCTQIANNSDNISEDYQWSQITLFDVAQHKGSPDEAYQSLMNLSKLELSNPIKYELLRRQGHYYRTKKRYMHAKSYYEEALNIALKSNSSLNLAKSYNDLGLIYLNENEYQLSIEYLQKSLHIKRQLNDPFLIRSTVTNLGLLYYKTGDYQEAIEHYLEAESILLERNSLDTLSQFTLIHLYSYFAAAYNKLGNTQLAESYLASFTKQLSLLENNQEILNRYLNLIEILIDIDSFVLARKILSQINLELHENDNNNAQLYYFMALIEHEFKNTDVAKTYALKALSEIQLHKTELYKQELYLLFSDIENSLNNPKQAYTWFKKYHNIKLGDIQNQVNQDFKFLKYEHSLENNRHNLIKVQLNNAILEKQNYKYLTLLLALLSSLIALLLYFYYHRQIMAKDNLLLNKDIEKHKELYEILENQPISFKNLFEKKPFPIFVLSDKNEFVYANFKLVENKKQQLIKIIKMPQTLALLKLELHPEEKIPINFDFKGFNQFKRYSHINIQRVLSGSYTIWSFCLPDIKLDLSTEINATNQFEYYLKQHQVFDILHTRKMIVDCMNMCLDVWTKTTSNNRIEFADQSKAWKINIDDGRLRTRSLDRYFSISTIPKNPRVLQVIKSCEFMLSLEMIGTQDKERVSFYLDKLKQLQY